MKIAVVYGSRSGNTRLIAETVAEALRPRGDVALLSAEAAELPLGTELLIVGGPTEGHQMTPPVKAFLDRLPRLQGIQVAAFDTRLRWPIWLSGSAARGIADRLHDLGGVLVAEPESFLVSREPKLYPGEADRARAWALALPAPARVAQTA